LYQKVQKAILFKENKSPGADKITAEMIRSGGTELIRIIHEILQQCWREEKLPEEGTKSISVI